VIIGGGFDLSVSGILPLAAVVYAKLCNGVVDWPLAMALAIGLGAIAGAINGAIITKARINPLITTLATLSDAGDALVGDRPRRCSTHWAGTGKPAGSRVCASTS
jgi:ribose transport system permease protein